MMVTTHTTVGLTLAVSLVWVASDLATAVTVGVLIGGVLPDVDFFAGIHRKTLYFPAYYSVAVVVLEGVVAVPPSTSTVGVAFFCLSAGPHSVPD